MDNKLSQERVTIPAESTLASIYMRKKLATSSEPSAAESARACSECFVLTDLTWLGKSKCLYGEKLARQGG